MTDQPTPQTEAGRRLHDELMRAYRDDSEAIRAIEAQARTEALDVEALRSMTDYWPNDGDHRWCDEDSGGGHRFDSQAWAEDFAREYAAILAAKADR